MLRRRWCCRGAGFGPHGCWAGDPSGRLSRARFRPLGSRLRGCVPGAGRTGGGAGRVVWPVRRGRWLALICRGVIDVHHHLWDLGAGEHRWLMGGQAWASDAELAGLRRSFILADLIPLAAAAGVRGAVVLQAVAEPWETPDL